MTILKILAVAAILVALVWSALAINIYSAKRYAYKPFNSAITSAMAAAIVMLIVSIFTIPKGHTLPDIIFHALEFKVTEADSNTVVLIALALITTVIVYLHLLVKTNVLIATYAIVIHLLAALVVLVVLVVVAVATLEARTTPKRRYRV